VAATDVGASATIGPMLLSLSVLLLLAPPRHFDVTAEYQAGAKRQGAVAVTFKAADPDVVVNETPGPRLALDPAQAVLVDKQPPLPKGAMAPDPKDGKYLDLALPVVFPVGLASGAASGPHDVKAKVTYFYCSKREGWCRKGTHEIEIPVKVP
jgi:hypothetical protein